jgi:SAM-dependent methyltransferase
MHNSPCGASFAPDGSPIAVYLTIPGDDEAALIDAAIPPEAAILELGCGVGRVSRPLVALGHSVTGVDNSDAMLAHASKLRGVETLFADIATLDLSPRTWPAVILASRMVNDERGPDFLAAAGRHLAPSGILLIERHEPGWVDAARPMSGERHGVSFSLADVEHPVPGVLRATMIYEVEGASYRQRFESCDVDDERLDAMAAHAGVQVTGFLDKNRTWVVLRKQ